ncbi:MAG: site-specific DNA-methyltransferase [Actinomycetota bacterium]|nr:site-specific DNA-methyltransferase [Actinomycetota bacterium]
MSSEVVRNRVLVGDALTMLRTLPLGSVDCVITSPPYYGLRDYGNARQLGHEASVQGWVDNLVAVAEELARVLKPEGCLWLNVGDTYSNHARHGAPPKGLLLGPERLLLALSERGWLVRNKAIWAKTNPAPSSTEDRLSCTWEPFYLLTRQPDYAFDLDAVRVPHRTARRAPQQQVDATTPTWAGPLAPNYTGLDKLKAQGLVGHPLGKNPGDVWHLATAGFRGAHFATFPAGLIRTPLLASCPERVCDACGSAWRRAKVTRTVGHVAVMGALGPTCSCRAHWRPGLVLDPFFGAGTTGLVAAELGRDWLGIELNPTFAALARQRIDAAVQAREVAATARAA